MNKQPFQILKIGTARWGFCFWGAGNATEQNRPYMMPHVSGHLLDKAIRYAQCAKEDDIHHKVTPSRNKREGFYAGKTMGYDVQTTWDNWECHTFTGMRHSRSRFVRLGK